jgi:hypothetical protein
MSDRELSAPPYDCAKVQQPVQPHQDLQLEFLKLLDTKGTGQLDEVVGPHPGAYTSATKTVTSADGTMLKATFAAGSQWGDIMNLTSIEDLKTGQKDSYANTDHTSGPATWSLNAGALKSAIQEYESHNYPHGGLPTFRARAQGAIQLTGLDLPSRIASKWEDHQPNGSLSVEAKFNPQNHSVSSEGGTVTNNNGQVVTRFAYTFNPDGNATSCARNVTPDAQTADYLEWSLKLK